MFSPLPPVLRNGRAALLLVVVACLTPERARAGCDHPGNIFKTNLLTAPKSPVEPAHVPDHKTPCPCHGAQCSGQPNPDVPPPTTAPVKQAQEVALPGRGNDPADARGGFAPDHSCPRPVTRPSSIFHPPRCA